MKGVENQEGERGRMSGDSSDALRKTVLLDQKLPSPKGKRKGRFSANRPLASTILIREVEQLFGTQKGG